MSLLTKVPPVDDVGQALLDALVEVVAGARPRTRPRLVLALTTLARGAKDLGDLAGLCDRTAVVCGQDGHGEMCALLLEAADLVREAQGLTEGELRVVFDAERIVRGLEPLVPHVPAWHGPRKVGR